MSRETNTCLPAKMEFELTDYVVEDKYVTVNGFCCNMSLPSLSSVSINNNGWQTFSHRLHISQTHLYKMNALKRCVIYAIYA